VTNLDFYPIAIEKLIEEFGKLPGIGSKTAQRLTLHVLNLPKEEVEEFANALVKARGTIKYCSICGNFTFLKSTFLKITSETSTWDALSLLMSQLSTITLLK